MKYLNFNVDFIFKKFNFFQSEKKKRERLEGESGGPRSKFGSYRSGTSDSDELDKAKKDLKGNILIISCIFSLIYLF